MKIKVSTSSTKNLTINWIIYAKNYSKDVKKHLKSIDFDIPSYLNQVNPETPSSPEEFGKNFLEFLVQDYRNTVENMRPEKSSTQQNSETVEE